MDKPIYAEHRQYIRGGLMEADADRDPINQFDRWFDEAVKSNIVEPNAMTLATVDTAGRPSSRIVLLKGFDQSGFVFYTNYESRKGRELAQNPHASLSFWWGLLERQVHVEGTAERLSPEDSDAYFATRPRESQLGAVASHQSMPIAGRKELERALERAKAQFEGRPVPRPAEWGGYRLRPQRIEFWQGREHRLHDRLCYTRIASGGWKLERLSP